MTRLYKLSVFKDKSLKVLPIDCRFLKFISNMSKEKKQIRFFIGIKFAAIKQPNY